MVQQPNQANTVQDQISAIAVKMQSMMTVTWQKNEIDKFLYRRQVKVGYEFLVGKDIKKNIIHANLIKILLIKKLSINIGLVLKNL